MIVRMMLVAFLSVFAMGPVFAEEVAAAASTETAKSAPVSTVEKTDKPGSLKAGKALMNEKRWAEAAAYFEGIGVQEAANGLKKREPWRLNNWARCLVALEKYDAAADVAQKGLDIDDSKSALWNNKGAAFSRAGKHDEAIEHYKKGIARLEELGGNASRLKANLKFLEDAKAGLIDEKGQRIEAKDTEAVEGAVKETEKK